MIPNVKTAILSSAVVTTEIDRRVNFMQTMLLIERCTRVGVLLEQRLAGKDRVHR